MAELHAEAKKALVCFLTQCEPNRALPREQSVIDGLADLLITASILLPEDLASCEITDFTCGDLGTRGLLKIALAKARPWGVLLPSDGTGSSPMNALANIVQPKPKHAHVDMQSQLSNISLAYLPMACQPSGERVDELLADVTKCKERGITWPFIFVKLEKWLPPWCEDVLHTSEEEEPSDAVIEMRRALGIKSKPRKTLNFLQWQAAFDNYAIAAAAVGQWSYTSALAHRSICLKIAYHSLREKRRHSLAIWYDDLARQKWSKCAYGADPFFNIDYASCTRDEEILKEARDRFDGEFKTDNASWNNAKEQSASNFKRPQQPSWESRGSYPKKKR